jgi:uracil-DNA glycosylase family 4
MSIDVDKLLEEAKASIAEKDKTEAVAEAEVIVQRETVIPDDYPEKSLCDCSDCPLQGNTAVLGEGTEDTVTPIISKRYLKRYDFECQAYSQRLDRDYSETYDIVLCAISPVELEMTLGRPMVGWSGQIIRETLRKMKVKKYFLTNALLCNYPEGMTESKIALAGRCCRPRLLAELKRVKAKLVVILGRVPLEAITGLDQKITSVEGQILPLGDFSILPISHPAGLSRAPGDFRDFVDYLRNAPKFLNGTYQVAKVPTTVVVNEDNYGEVLRDIEAHKLVSLDLETTKNGLFPYGRDPDKIRCMVVGVSDSKSYIIPGYSSPYFDDHPNFVKDPRLKEVLPKCDLITHNGPFDMGFMLQEGFKNVKMYFDTFLAHYMLDEREFSHGLKVIGPKYTGSPKWEEGARRYLPHKNSSYDLIPDEALYTYATWDGCQTYQLATGVDFIHKMPKVFWNLIMPCANMFTEIRHKGFPIDMDLLLGMSETLEKEYNDSVAELISLVGHDVDPQSSQEMIKLLYDELGFQVLPRYGRTSSKKILPLLGGPICESILECREVAKFKGTYVAGISSYMDWDCRIHPLTKIHGAVTGRISTENPSVMNITKRRGIKKLYLPEEGHLILEADQGQMETLS